MDCVTCLLVGMCMLCGHNLEAASPGRPMTRAEVDTALQSVVRRLNVNTHTNSNSYLRQSKLDPRFSQMGIGKRYGPKVDPYNFPFGLGKRSQDNGDEIDNGVFPALVDVDPEIDLGTVEEGLMPSEDVVALDLVPGLKEVSNLDTDTNPGVLSQLISRSKISNVLTNSQFDEGNSRYGRLHRMQQRLGLL